MHRYPTLAGKTFDYQSYFEIDWLLGIVSSVRGGGLHSEH